MLVARRSRLSLLAILFVLLAYWLVLLRWMGAIWNTLPEYNYGWGVPILCGLLFWQRWKTRPPSSVPSLPASRLPLGAWRFALAALLFALAFSASRLFLDTMPFWRRSGLWMFSGSAVLLMLSILGLIGGRKWFRHFAFPVAFFMVAVPWPTLIEAPLIQTLSRANAGVTADLVNFLGIPAVCEGNVIEIAAGKVGVDDACSGIRSVQSTLMISLFFGGLHQLSILRRLILLLSGFALAFVLNIVRTTLLTTVAARQGIDAISGWHDPAGITILLACFMVLWLIGVALARSKEQSAKREGRSAEHSEGEAPNTEHKDAVTPSSTLTASRLPLAASRFALGASLLLILLVPWILSEAWFRKHEANRAPAIAWTAAFPAPQVSEPQVSGLKSHPSTAPSSGSEPDAPGSSLSASRLPLGAPKLSPLEIPPKVAAVLKYDSGEGWQWQDEAGHAWQAFLFEWNATTSIQRRFVIGEQAQARHKPEVCFPAVGFKMLRNYGQKEYVINKVPLNFNVYEFSQNGSIIFVFSCFWESAGYEVEDDAANLQLEVSTVDSFRIVCERLRLGNRGITGLCRVFKLGVTGPADVETAEQALRRQLEQLIQPEPAKKPET